MAGVGIAPFILLPFVENAFKHGVSQKSDNNWIVIFIEVDAGAVMLEVENTYRSMSKSENAEIREGIGLKNVKRRLELIYDGSYDLNIEERESSFYIRLELVNKN